MRALFQRRIAEMETRRREAELAAAAEASAATERLEREREEQRIEQRESPPLSRVLDPSITSRYATLLRRGGSSGGGAAP